MRTLVGTPDPEPGPELWLPVVDVYGGATSTTGATTMVVWVSDTSVGLPPG